MTVYFFYNPWENDLDQDSAYSFTLPNLLASSSSYKLRRSHAHYMNTPENNDAYNRVNVEIVIIFLALTVCCAFTVFQQGPTPSFPQLTFPGAAVIKPALVIGWSVWRWHQQDAVWIRVLRKRRVAIGVWLIFNVWQLSALKKTISTFFLAIFNTHNESGNVCRCWRVEAS